MNIQKLTFCLGSIMLLTSCHVFQRSELQVAVRDSRKTAATKEASLEAIRETLARRGVEHKMVSFRYEVGARPLLPPMGSDMSSLGGTPMAFRTPRHGTRERQGILFRDESKRKDSWYYIDAETRRAIWLPDDAVPQQIGFAMRKRIELLRVQEFDRGVTNLAKDAGLISGETDWNQRFLKAHGTEFNAASPMDVAKMRVLRGS
ncbi:MAG TPA: hypothetical protein VF585_11590 [Chthoniobacterales bacterium]|jgi:hypothetical protein